ncbi:MAG TPA: peptidylprolyl isomerase A [Gammaproteobacteria bacterium]|nr:peptidylprolyl isomerase A [Gammaproteobacteria bacterium]
MLSQNRAYSLFMRSLILIGTTAMIAFSTTEANADQPQVILTTSVGTMIATLDEERAPHTVANFLELVEAEFYDGLIFHRVIAGFVIQTGGYDVHMERREGPRNIPNESFNGLMNRKGTLSMARLADPDSANSQFFINLEANTHLDALPGKPGYAVFGHLVTGTDVAEIIEFAETGIRQGMAGVPLEPILILTARRRREESRPGTSTSQRLLRDL